MNKITSSIKRNKIYYKLFQRLCSLQIISKLKYQKVIDDFPPGGLPEYLTDVNEPGPAYGLSYYTY
jgi:hypothetical protein